jgi:MFS transporter, FHS family, L-fucose permease
VAIGSFLVSFLSQPEIGGLTPQAAGKDLSYYWGGAMIGRFFGAAVLTRVDAGRMLAGNALVALLLVATAIMTTGKLAMAALLAVGLFNSIMFPTIFTLAIKNLGRHTAEGAGILCMAIVGGALVPLAQGALADRIGLHPSFAVPALCYLYIIHYGIRGHIPRPSAQGG